jgi:hypothetical protein
VNLKLKVIFLQLLQLPIGLGFVYAVATYSSHLVKTPRILVVAIFVLVFCYYMTWFNTWVMRQKGEISRHRVLQPSRLGHVLYLLGAVAIGYGFVHSLTLLIFAGGALIWFGLDAFSKLRQIVPIPDALSAVEPKDAVLASLLNAIENQRKSDPLVGAKVGGHEIYLRLLEAMKTERGAHTESLLCALGALAGYSCQASLRAQASMIGSPETAVFTVIGTKDGKKYFFGDPLNELLAESQHSIWSLAASAAQHNGGKLLLDLNGIFSHVTSTIGDESFGVPRFPEGRLASDSPKSFLKALWPVLFPVAMQFCAQPSEWPIAFGVAIQKALDASKDVLAPDVALTIVMESAIPMSKIDLASA